MDQKTMTLKCMRCGKTGLMLNMVMDASRKGMVCRVCAGLPPKETGHEKSQAREMFSKPKSPQASRGKYACANCKYRFSTSKPLSETSCPYCGSRRVTTMDELSADKLIHDATRREFDF